MKIKHLIISGGVLVLSLILLSYLLGTKNIYDITKESSTPEPVATSTPTPKPTSTPTPKPTHTLRGKASYYNRSVCVDNGKTYGTDCLFADGSLFNDQIMAAACPAHIPYGRTISVAYRDKTIEVTCKGAGPFSEIYPGRIIDLTEGAFSRLAPLSRGVIDVVINY